MSATERKAKASIAGLMDLPAKATGLTTKLMDLRSTCGKTAESATANGSTMTCQVTALQSTQKVCDMKANICLTKSMATASTNGPMAEFTRAGGMVASSTVQANTTRARKVLSMGYGKTVNESSGSPSNKFKR